MDSDDTYARVFQNAPSGLLLLEKDSGKVLAANVAFLELTQRTREAVVGHCFWRPPLIASGEAGAEVQEHLQAGGAVAGAELPFQRDDGHWLVLEVNGHVTDGAVYMEVRDATAKEQARLAERMEMLRAQAGRTAHEFGNLRQTLAQTGEALLIAAGQGRDVLRELEAVQRAVERAGSIVNQLGAFSGSLPFQNQPVALNTLVEGLLPKLREMFGRDVEIVPDLSSGVGSVMADPVQLRQAILKLAANSSDAMGRSGTFCLQTCKVSTIEPGLGTTSAPGGAFAMLAVSDNGPGLDDQSWAHLYEPFFSTKSNGRGPGLGLAAVYGIVRQAGGRLWAYSQPGQGATFRIYLPLAGARCPALPAALQDARGPARILLVESNDGLRTVMANLLRRQGYRVRAAIDIKEALRIADATGSPDLLISRPEPELARRLTILQPRLRILYLGGYSDALLAQDHGLPPGTGFLQRPFEPETLRERVAEILSQPL